MQHHFFTPVPDMTVVRSDVPEALLAVVQKALAKRADDRFATTLEMQQAIEAIRFEDEMRAQGERMLRDLVLGVALPKVHAGALPPLQDTLLMTPPLAVRARDAAVRRRMRNRVIAGIAGSALLLAALAYQFVWRQPAFATPTVAVVPPGGPDAPGGGPARDNPAPDPEPDHMTTDPVASRPTAGGSVASPVLPAPEPATPRGDPRAAAGLPPNVPPDAIGGATGKVRVRVLPSDAEILVDGRVLGRGVVLDSLLPAGSRRLRARAPGYEPLDTVITVQAGETSQVGTLRLVPEGRP
jgi:hypothetical protein